ncbi:MAG: hypothetical protein Kow0067_18150 [Coriobacteriia bacterium]
MGTEANEPGRDEAPKAAERERVAPDDAAGGDASAEDVGLRVSPVENELRRDAGYRRHRRVVVGFFILAIAIAAFGFQPLGEFLAGVGADIWARLVGSGTSPTAAGYTVLLATDAIAFVLVLLLAFFVGPRVPSGFLHVFLGILVPLSLSAMQPPFFEATYGAGGLADSQFARWSFVAVFVFTILGVETGVSAGRRLLEKRARR